MKRRLPTILSVLSLLICLGAAVLWGRSFTHSDSLSYGRNGYHPNTALIRRFVKLESARGHLVIGKGYFASIFFRSASPDEGFSWSSRPLHIRPTNTLTVWSFLGFQYGSLDRPGMLHASALHVPYWSLLLLTSILPSITLMRWRKRASHARANRCPACGYDLRATPECCPECGTRAPRVERTTGIV